MNELTLGPYLRRERERRGLTLRSISENTKVSMALLEGLEGDDISRWPGGIFRRAFVRSYAECVGLDSDEIVRRFEEQYKPAEPDPALPVEPITAPPAPATATSGTKPLHQLLPALRRARLMGTAADLSVAVVLAFGSAAAGSRLLWPVLLIAGYYALGTLLTGTTPMVALLSDPTSEAPSSRPDAAGPSQVAPVRSPERRHQPRRTNERPRQRRGVQAGARS